jgi:hypothetical protein
MHALTATVRRIRIPAHPDPPTRITGIIPETNRNRKRCCLNLEARARFSKRPILRTT